MIRPASNVRLTLEEPRTTVAAPSPAQVAYGRAFWLTYASNLTLMTAHCLLFRYADFVFYLGGGELILGWIVGLGMVGSLAMRVAQGVGVDRYGARKMWLLSSGLFAVTCLLHLTVSRVDGPLIFLLRIAYNCSIAGFFGASITFVSSRAPVARMAEVVGMLGTSGFLAMVLGTCLGDVLLGGSAPSHARLQLMFVFAAALGTGCLVLGWFATRGEPPKAPRRHVSPFALLRRYHPGAVLVVGAATGFGLGLPGTFLRPYAKSIDIAGIAIFFAIYAPTAFVARFLTRHLPARLGNRRVMLLGLGSMVAGMLLFTIAVSPALLALPAVFLGFAHALLFPSVIAAGSRAFPVRHRGLATALVLAAFDLGTLVGSPVAGAILSYAGWVGLPAFPTMFVGVAAVVATAAAAFARFGPVDVSRSVALSATRVPLPNSR